MGYVEPGDIVFHAGTGLQSKLIRYATRSPWSHVSLVTQVVGERFNVLDVLHRRVIHSIDSHADEDSDWHIRRPRLPLSVYGYERQQWFDRKGFPEEITQAHVVLAALELHQMLPPEYPYVELLAYLPVFRRTAIGRRLLRRTSRLVCSAMVAAAWASMGFRWYNGPDGVDEISPDWVDPGTAWKQANRDRWPLIQTKKGYEHA